jgi:hypothetical protein
MNLMICLNLIGGQVGTKLKSYEKASRAILILGWIILIAVIGIAAAVLIPVMLGGKWPHDPHALKANLLTALFFCVAIFHFVLAKAVKQHKEWGRTVGIIFGILQLFGFPIGTIIGAYILWCLIKGWDEK